MVLMDSALRTPLSRLKTSLERRRIPILDMVITPTHSFALVKTDPSPVVVIVHIDEYPTDPDWNQCIDFQVHAVNDFGCNRGFIWIPGNKTPNREQAKRVVETIKRKTALETLRTSVLNPNANLLTKFVTDSFFFFQRKAGMGNGLNMKFFTREEEALHHILIDPDSKTGKDILVTVEYLFDRTQKAARKHKPTQ